MIAPPPAGPPAFRHARRVLRDPSEFGDVVSGVNLTVDFLRPAARPTRIEQFQSPQWALDFGVADLNALVRGALPAGWASLCLVRGGDSRWQGIGGQAGALLCTPPGDELDGQITPGFTWTTFALPPEEWARCQTFAGAEPGALRRFAGGPLPAETFQRINRELEETHLLLRAALADPCLGPFAARAAAQVTGAVACLAWETADAPPPTRQSPRNRARLARRADAWMREHLRESIHVPDVCLALRISRRELEYAFRATFDTSPQEHLRNLRLNAVHRALRDARHADASVLDIALAHGVTHPGRFAAAYRALFGESPGHARRG